MNKYFPHNRRLSIRDINQALFKGETTVTKICNESLKIIEDLKHLNSFITVCKDEALQKALQLDQELAVDTSCLQRSLLYGVPISVKDNFCTKELLTTCGSRMLSNFKPTYNATAVSSLNHQNCILVGKTNMDEFAMGSSSTTSYYGPAANSWKSEQLTNVPKVSKPSDWHMAGGSSTGSAVSVATGACFASLGTDTGGSTRQPASLTGVVGFKPTYGLISRFGLIPLAHCLDVVSIFARTVDDAHIVFDAVIGQDEHDLTSVNFKTNLISSFQELDRLNLKQSRKIKVGVPDLFIERGEVSGEVSQRYSEILRYLINGGSSLNEIEVMKLELPYSSLATECYTIIACAEISSNMSCYDGIKYGHSSNKCKDQSLNQEFLLKANRDEGFGTEVKKRILLGNYFLLAENREIYLNRALKLRRLISEEFAKAFSEYNVDFIITPSTPSTSESYDEWTSKQDDNKLFHEDYFLIPSNLANLPSISLPAGLSGRGLPFGIQLVGKRFHDLDLLSIAKLFERELLVK